MTAPGLFACMPEREGGLEKAEVWAVAVSRSAGFPVHVVDGVGALGDLLSSASDDLPRPLSCGDLLGLCVCVSGGSLVHRAPERWEARSGLRELIPDTIDPA